MKIDDLAVALDRALTGYDSPAELLGCFDDLADRVEALEMARRVWV